MKTRTTDETMLPKVPDTDYAGATRTGMKLLGIGLGGFLLWGSLAPLDEGVPAPGVLAVDSKRKHIDHLYGGLVEKILVRDGQKVKEGEGLVVLNATQGKAALNAALTQWRSAAATVARLKAERNGDKTIAFPPELTSAGEDAAQVIRSQEELMRSRRSALDGELKIIRESVRGLADQLVSLEQLRAGREKQVQLFNAQLASFQKLNRQGFISQNQLLDLERQLAEIQSKQSEDLANIGGIKARLADFRMRESQRLMEFRRDLEAQLAEADREEATLRERLTMLQDAYSRLTVRSPVAGTVVGVALSTVGGVIKPGERMMDIVPDNEELVVEARLAPNHIDRVHVGLPADVRFDAYASMAARPMVSGKVMMVSADTVTDARSGETYYPMRVAVPADELRRLGQVSLQPGMQSSVMIKTGERTLLVYLLRPLTRRFETALTER